MGLYCDECGTELIENVCPRCSRETDFNKREKKIAKKFFASPDEKIVTVLGDSYLEEFLNSGRVKSGFAIISNKRAYFKGKRLFISSGNNSNKHLIRAEQSRTVDLKDITGTGFDNYSDIKWLIGGIIWAITSIAVLLIAFS